MTAASTTAVLAPERPETYPAGIEEPTATRREIREHRAAVGGGRSWFGRGVTLLAGLVAAFSVWLVVITPLQQGRDQRGLEREFAQLIESQNAWIGGVIPEGEPVALLEIPEVGLRQVVVEGTDSGSLRQGPGHLRSSPLPGQAGNSVIAGRRMTYGSPMRHINELEAGDLITVTTGQGRSRYEVTDVRKVEADEPDVVNPSTDDRLTLTTSDPAFLAGRRLVVEAELLGKVLPTRGTRTNVLREAELGLHGDRSAIFPLLLWLVALVIVAFGAMWLRLTWRRWPAYLVTMPVLALLVLLVFDSATPLLPSTL